MPHFGHDPGLVDRTSGCIGQVYSAALDVVAEVVAEVVADAGAAGARAAAEGSAMKRSRHPAQQNTKTWPSAPGTRCGLGIGTCMPHTGSVPIAVSESGRESPSRVAAFFMS